MEQIPTAEEYLIANAQVYTEDFDYEETVGKDDVFDTKETITNVMIEFAKIHVIAALKQASIKGELQSANYDGYIIDKSTILYPEDANGVYNYKINEDSILNAYSLDNIK